MSKRDRHSFSVESSALGALCDEHGRELDTPHDENDTYFDSSFEFDAPRFCRFPEADAFSQQQADEWFSKPHPLHEAPTSASPSRPLLSPDELPPAEDGVDDDNDDDAMTTLDGEADTSNILDRRSAPVASHTQLAPDYFERIAEFKRRRIEREEKQRQQEEEQAVEVARQAQQHGRRGRSAQRGAGPAARTRSQSRRRKQLQQKLQEQQQQHHHHHQQEEQPAALRERTASAQNAERGAEYVPRKFTSALIRQWEQHSGKKWYSLDAAGRREANAFIEANFAS